MTSLVRDLSDEELSVRDLSNGHLSDGGLSDGDLSDGDLSNGHLSNGQLSDGELLYQDQFHEVKILFLYCLHKLYGYYCHLQTIADNDNNKSLRKKKNMENKRFTQP